MMMSPSWCSALLFLTGFVALVCLTTPVQGVQCYICSWSPADSGRVDHCTRGKFNESVRTHTCEMGCEVVTVYDKNGKLDFFYRNCVGNTTAITNSCHNETSKAITKEICTCNGNYCNASPAGLMAPGLHWGVTLVSAVLALLLFQL